jgi:hypothetical protein
VKFQIQETEGIQGRISGGGAKYSDFLSKILFSPYVLQSQSMVEYQIRDYVRADL